MTYKEHKEQIAMEKQADKVIAEKQYRQERKERRRKAAILFDMMVQKDNDRYNTRN